QSCWLLPEAHQSRAAGRLRRAVVEVAMEFRSGMAMLGFCACVALGPASTVAFAPLALAQAPPAAPQAPAGAPQPPAGAAPAADPDQYTADELQQLVGPIALYPDPLIGIILPASTFPLDVVQAQRYIERRAREPNAQPSESWHESVRALVNYP